MAERPDQGLERQFRPMPPQELAVSPGLYLRLRSDADHEAIYRAICDNGPHLGTHLPWTRGYTAEQAAIDHRSSVEGIRQGRLAVYCIYEGGEFTGCIGLHSFNGPRAALGYWLVESAQGRGVATACAAKVLDMAFGHMGFREVAVEMSPENLRSRAVAERLGGVMDDITSDGSLRYVIES